MTQHDDDAFTPDTVDERVDQLASLAPQSSSPPSARVVQRLHALYEEDQASTERVWQRLVQHVDEHEESDVSREYRQPGSLSGIQEGKGVMQQGTLLPRKTGPTRLMLVAAVLFAALFVSSLLWAAHIIRSTQLATSANPVSTGQAAPSSPPGIYIAKPGEISRLDIQTRKVIWHTAIPAKVAAISKYAVQPIVIGDTVYLIVGNTGNTVLAFDANKGQFLWSGAFGLYAVHISVVDGVLYVAADDTGSGGKLYAVDPVKGKIKAAYKLPATIWNPMVANGVEYYTDGPSLYAQRLTDKKPLWHQQIGVEQDLAFVFVKNGIVYASAMMTVLNKEKSTTGQLYAFDAKTGKQLWKSSTVPIAVSDFTVTNDMVYCVSDAGDLDAFDSHTGKHLWHLQANTDRVAYDLLVNAGILYTHHSTSTRSDGIEALQAKSGKQLWQASFTGSNYHHPLGLQHGILYTIADGGKAGSRSIDALNASSGALLWHLSINGNAEATVA